MVRRGVAGTALVVVVILIALGVHSCEVSQRNSALKDYASSVASLLQNSSQTGQQLFTELSGAGGSTNALGVANQVSGNLSDARKQLATAEALSVPDEMKSAQQNIVLVFQMRRDALEQIAGSVQQAQSKQNGPDAVKNIAAQMGRLYASDVLYKDYAAPAIAAALNGVGVTPNSANGPPISSAQFVSNISWLTPSYVASRLGASIPAARGPVAPGVHGHRMVSCSVGGVALVPGGANTLAANPPPSFSCTFENDGQNNETDVTVKVQVSGTSLSAQQIVPQTVPLHQYTVQVALPSTPATGSQTVTATVERVPGETSVVHNTLTFPITFH